MIDLQVFLPPFEKTFNAPPQLIYCGYLFCRQIMPIRGNIIFGSSNFIANHPNRRLGLILTWCSKEYQGIIKDITAIFCLVFFNDRPGCVGFDTANKMFLCTLKQIKIPVRLVSPIHNAGLPYSYDLINKRAFTTIAFCKEDLVWDSIINVKFAMSFSFFGAFSVVSPMH